jgi:hypothetical protein
VRRDEFDLRVGELEVHHLLTQQGAEPPDQLPQRRLVSLFIGDPDLFQDIRLLGAVPHTIRTPDRPGRGVAPAEDE